MELPDAPETTMVILLALLAGCDPPEHPNVLLVLLDDVGVDKFSAYGEYPEAPPTPTFEALAADGVVYRNAFANPKCSATRAGVLTGRYGFRYGIGDHLAPNDGWSLPIEEETLPERLRRAGYTSAAIGKWHLADTSDEALAPFHPLWSGFDVFEGTLANLHAGPSASIDDEDYFHYRWVKNGVMTERDGYATEDTTDAAIDAVHTLPEPWFVYLAYNAAHAPYHAPPAHLNVDAVPDDAPKPALYDAMLKAIDLEVGRLLDALDPEVRARTVIVVMGDNGTPAEVAVGAAAGDPGKGSLHDSGIRVPLIVTGPGVRPEDDALVQHTDLFATLADLAGARGDAPVDAISFAASPRQEYRQRRWVYVERFADGPGEPRFWERGVRTEDDKLVRELDGTEAFYELDQDPAELKDLSGHLDPERRWAMAQLREVMFSLEPTP